MNIGAPQGISLSGILFAVYINRIVKILKICKCVKYADDLILIIYHSGETTEDVQRKLQEDIDNLQLWAQEYGMVISYNKTKCILFRPCNLKCSTSIAININGINIDTVNNFRYLGIILEPTLKFNSHVNEVCSRMTSRMYLINRHKKLFSTTWSATSLVISLSDYGLPVWGNLTETSYCRLHRLMIRLGTLVILPHLRNRISPQDLLEKLNWLTVKEQYVLYSLKFIYKHIICKSSLTRCFPEFVKLESATRQKNDFVVPRLKTVFGTTSIFYQGIKLWNSLSSTIKNSEITSLSTFDDAVTISLIKERENVFIL